MKKLRFKTSTLANYSQKSFSIKGGTASFELSCYPVEISGGSINVPNFDNGTFLDTGTLPDSLIIQFFVASSPEAGCPGDTLNRTRNQSFAVG